MRIPKTVILATISVLLLSLLVAWIDFNPDKRQMGEYLDPIMTESQDTEYKFDNPVKAYHLLEQLDVFSVVPEGFTKGANFSSVSGGFKLNENYCSEHRAYFVNNPDVVFKGNNFITNFIKSHKLRSQVIPIIGGVDLHPKYIIKNETETGKEFINDMSVEANIFLTQNIFFKKRQVGKQFSCLSQASNHIPGHNLIYRKDKVAQALVDYARGHESRPQCFSFDRYFPKTWVLQEKDQCLEFFKEFRSKKYQKLKKERNVVYFRKIGADVHEGKGVFPVNDEEETYIQELYKNGSLCGKVKDNNLIQYNVHNLLLLENHKFGFRMFMLIASSNPVIAYYYDGYARLSLNEYDPKSKEIITFVTNIGMNIKEAEKETGLTEQEIQESTLWFLEDFHNYLYETGQVTDPNWLDNHVRRELKKVMIHLIRMGQKGFFQASSLFEMFGLDFVMDENFELWFIEANTMPLLNGFTKRSTKTLNKMLVDMLEIVTGLLRSRMKRVVMYINALSKEISSDGVITNLEERRREFQEISKNKFEPEFEPSSDNGFQKIIDENEQGTKIYSDLILEECL